MKRKIKPYERHGLILRLIDISDIRHTLIWRNNQEHRMWFGSSDLISYEEHEKWFLNYLDKDDDFIFIITDSQSRLIGQLSIYEIDWVNRSGVFGRFMVNPNFSNSGYMKIAAQLGVDLAKETFLLKTLSLEVKENNEKAISIYQKIGFVKKKVNNKKMLEMAIIL